MRLMSFVLLDMTRFHHDKSKIMTILPSKLRLLKIIKMYQTWEVNYRSKNTNTTTYNNIIMRGGALPCIPGFCPAQQGLVGWKCLIL